MEPHPDTEQLRRELAEARAELAERDRQQAALIAAGAALNSERTLEGVLRRIVEEAMALTGARYGALGVLDRRREQLDKFVTIGIDAATALRIGDLPRGGGILGVLIDEPTPLRLRRLQDHPRSVGFPPHHPPMESFLGVPIVTADGVSGRIYLTEKQDAPEFSAEDERLVKALASQAAIAIDNASLNDELDATAAQLAAASRHKSEFLANMSHELRSPLNTILGYARLLLDDPRNLEDDQVEDLRLMHGSGTHLLTLITELLDLQRIEAGRLALRPEPVDLAALAADVLASLVPSVPEGVELTLDASRLAEPIAGCDPTRVRQILLNVLGNALKFTTQGAVTLQLLDDRDDGMVELRVVDTGPGIEPRDQARIFESFYQSRAASQRTPGPREGAGLGLAITRLLAELHGGTATLRSQPGEGTAVSVLLPRRARVGVDGVDAP